QLKVERVVGRIFHRGEKQRQSAAKGIKLALRDDGLRGEGTAPGKLSDGPAASLEVVHLDRIELKRLQGNGAAPGRGRLGNPLVDQFLVIYPKSHAVVRRRPERISLAGD